MSIATDEALEWHCLHGDEIGDESDSYSADEMDEAAYIAGRTAEPTEAETWIIARALYEHYADLEFGSEVSDDEWERYKRYYGETPMQCSEFIRAKEVLTAARKAVTE